MKAVCTPVTTAWRALISWQWGPVLLIAAAFSWLPGQARAASVIADPDILAIYSRGDRIDSAFDGVTLGVGVRNWSRPSGSPQRFVTGHAVLGEYIGDATIGWELATVFSGSDPIFSPVDRLGSQNAVGAYSADSVYLIVNPNEAASLVWADISNPGNSSNRGIAITAYDSGGDVLGAGFGSVPATGITRVGYTHPTAEIDYFTVDISGGFWTFPLHAVGATVIPEPSGAALLLTFALAAISSRRRVDRSR